MDCISCGHSNRDQAKFCEGCGASLRRSCPECGAELQPEARFCDACGAALKPAATQGPSSSAARQSMHEGERRVVSVLFADAAGHTPLSERLDEEEVYNLMQGCFARMQESVERYGGTVIQFTGDGILALFGAPVAYEDSARRAVMAGLDMQRSLKEYAEEVKKRHPIECAYRVGINTGPVVVGSISEKLDLDFTAVGDTVNLASRMETLAVAGTVYLTESTYRSIREYIECECLGPKDIKGKSEPVVVYRAQGERNVHSRIEASVERGLTPYTGRDEEQSMLRSYMDKAKRGQGQVVFISGEAGIGKSRTLLEFRRGVESEGVRWIEGQCISFGENIPYLPVVDILKRTFNIDESDSDGDIAEKVGAGIEGWGEGAKATAPYIKFLLNAELADEAVATMDPMERRAGFFDAFRAVVIELSRSAPLALVIEDLHWIDEQSEEIVKAMVDAAAAAPVLIVLTARPGYTSTLGDRTYLSRLALTQLTPEDSAELVERALGTSDLPPELQKLIARKTEGNPFFIEEVTRSLIETGALLESKAGFGLGTEVEDIRIPNTIHEVILARIDRLDPKAREAIQLASVIGREFTVRLLNRISDLEERLTDSLDELKKLELIYESGYQPELAYMFKHALTHDVAYSTLLIKRRRVLHRTVADGIETLFAERLTEHYEALAYHYEKSQTWDKALDYLERAGDKAVSACANQEAIGFYTRALKASEILGDEARSRRLGIAEKRAWIYFTVADYVAAVESAGIVLKVAEETDDAVLESHALSLIGFFQLYGHDFEPAEASLIRAIELSETQDETDILFMSRTALFAIQKLLNRHEEAKEQRKIVEKLARKDSNPFALSNWIFSSGLDSNWRGDYAAAAARAGSWRELPDDAPQVMILFARWSEAVVFASMGRYTQSLQFLQAIEAECERIGEIAVRARALNTMGWIYGDLQNNSRAIELSDRGIIVALEEGDEPEKISNARLNWGDTLVGTQRLDEADKLFSPVGKVIGNPRPEDHWMLWRFSQHYFHSAGELCLAREETERALGLADECLVLAEPSESKKYIVKARRLRGHALLSAGDIPGALVEMKSAAQIAKVLGNPPQLWKSYVGLAEVLRANNESGASDDALREAGKVVAAVAKGLDDESLRNDFLNSDEIRAIGAGDVPGR